VPLERKSALAITAPGQARSGGAVLISPQTILDGYPIFASPNIVVKVLFNPNVKYQGLIHVQSELTPACGTWKVIKLDLDLETSVPHGKSVSDRGGDHHQGRDARSMSGRQIDCGGPMGLEKRRATSHCTSIPLNVRAGRSADHAP